MTYFLTFAITSLASFLGVTVFARISVKRNILDIPNERSSHERPTPRGAGIVIVFASLIGYLAVSFYDPRVWSPGFLAGSVLIATIGLIDDIRSVPTRWRLLVQCIAASILILDLGTLNSLWMPGTAAAVELGWFGWMITFFWVIGLTNAFNFMDGIDGIAGLQGVACGLGWTLIGGLSGDHLLTLFGTILAGACLGFLLLNWQPARVFMGDVGSTFLGFTFASIPLVFGSTSQVPLPMLGTFSILFLWIFVFDTAFTRIRQIGAGKRFWLPHREHLYQKLVLAGETHGRVALFYGVSSIAIAAACGLTFRSTEFVPLLLLIVSAATFILPLWVGLKRRSAFSNGR